MKIVYGVSKLKNNESDIAKKRIGKSKLNSKKKNFWSNPKEVSQGGKRHKRQSVVGRLWGDSWWCL